MGMLLLHYQMCEVGAGCQVTPGHICFICYLHTAPANTDTPPQQAVIKLGMFILIPDVTYSIRQISESHATLHYSDTGAVC